MHSISDLTTTCRRTTGDVPPKLVGASTTVVGSKMYLFGGRLVAERRMVSDLYAFDLHTYNWEILPASPEDDIPPARYFHSADAWNNHLIVFGGMGNKPDTANPEDLVVLNDVRLFDLATRHWVPAHPPDPTALMPKARYAHLSSVSADRLFVIGGQDINNVWLDDVYVYDLKLRQWVHRRDYLRHCGTYRSVAVAADLRVRMPQDELRGQPSTLGPLGTRFTKEDQKLNKEFTPSDALVHLPYSTKPTDEYPNDIYLYSNYNFTDVKRELEVFTPLPTPDADFAITDRSASMTGSALPPGLRFPAGAILGTHLIIAGTYLAHTYQSFSIWALDLLTNTWSRIDPGTTLASGSWFRSCLWPEAAKFLIFGNQRGNLVEDYNRRLLSWDHVAAVDLAAFGIYQPPSLALEIPMQELGLAALEEEVLADFELVCDDGRRIRCSRQVLEERWPWFKAQLKLFTAEAARLSETHPTPNAVPLPALPGAVGSEPRHDPRLTPRSFALSEPYPISLALLQYFYTRALLTPLQHAPAVLSQLLVLASTYGLTHLQSLVVHAMHRALSNSTSVGVYEVATLCGCRSLQIRALKTVMAYNQRRPAGRTRREGDSAGGGRGGGPPGSGGGDGRTDRPSPGYGGAGPGSGGRPDMSAARPRGMSDAYFSRPGYGGSGASARVGLATPNGSQSADSEADEGGDEASDGSSMIMPEEALDNAILPQSVLSSVIVASPRAPPSPEGHSEDAPPEESVLPDPAFDHPSPLLHSRRTMSLPITPVSPGPSLTHLRISPGDPLASHLSPMVITDRPESPTIPLSPRPPDLHKRTASAETCDTEHDEEINNFIEMLGPDIQTMHSQSTTDRHGKRVSSIWVDDEEDEEDDGQTVDMWEDGEDEFDADMDTPLSASTFARRNSSVSIASTFAGMAYASLDIPRSSRPLSISSTHTFGSYHPYSDARPDVPRLHIPSAYRSPDSPESIRSYSTTRYLVPDPDSDAPSTPTSAVESRSKYPYSARRMRHTSNTESIQSYAPSLSTSISASSFSSAPPATPRHSTSQHHVYGYTQSLPITPISPNRLPKDGRESPISFSHAHMHTPHGSVYSVSDALPAIDERASPDIDQLSRASTDNSGVYDDAVSIVELDRAAANSPPERARGGALSRFLGRKVGLRVSSPQKTTFGLAAPKQRAVPRVSSSPSLRSPTSTGRGRPSTASGRPPSAGSGSSGSTAKPRKPQKEVVMYGGLMLL